MSDGGFQGIRHPWGAPPEAGEAVEVAPGVLWMRVALPMRLDHVNVYALDDGEGWTVVDTGFDNSRTRDTWRTLLRGPLAGRPVRRVIATHHHPDHIGLAGWFQSEHGAELWTTRTAWLTARMLVLDEHVLPVPETIAFWRAAGMDPELLDRRASERPMNFADVVAPLPLGFRRIAQGEACRMAGREWEVHVGHGHAPEQATFWSRDCNLVIGADQLLPGISPNIGVYATEPAADPLAEWLESCDRLSALAREDHLVLPGHKLPFTGLPLRLRQKVENHENALARLREHLVAPRTAAQCFVPLFRREIEAPVYGMALAEAVAHLNYLHNAGLVTRSLREDGAWLWQSVET